VACVKKKARQKQGWLVFQDESGVSQKPPLRRTWAPKGQTPVVVHSFNWKKLSISAAIAYRWDGKRSRLYFHMQPGSYDGPALIAFLKDLKTHFRKQYVILIWDGLPAHKSREMQDFLEQQSDWLDVERLPSYSPDLNPVEDLWENIKGNELANQSADHLGAVAQAVDDGMERVKDTRGLLFGFLHHTGLFFD
jgi:hypothetical protein